jgi:hypothetical protein
VLGSSYFNLSFCSTIPNIILGGHGCPICASKTNSYDNDIIDEKLKDKHVRRIENYISATTKITFECNKCNHRWKSTSRSILKSKNCPKCSLEKSTKERFLSDEIVDIRLKNKNIVKLEDYKGGKHKIKFKCIIYI